MFFKTACRVAFFLILFILGLNQQVLAETTNKYSSWGEACEAVKNVVAEGDLIFLDIPMQLFREVASGTNSWTSHVGIVFLDGNGKWIVSESKVPLSKDTPLCDYIKASSKFRFEVKRLNRPLDKNEIFKMRSSAQSLLGQWYHLGFQLDSNRLFCSKLVYLVYESIGVKIGKIQTFKELLEENPNASLAFWRAWYFGSIPWERRTITPASQLRDEKLYTVLDAY